MIVFISCVKKKQSHESKAKDMYISDFFKSQLKYAYSLNPSRIFILSAKYGVVELEDTIQPYEKTLNNMTVSEREEWGKMVTAQLESKKINFNEKTIFLCGEKYRKNIIDLFSDVEIPLCGMGIGKQLQWLKANTNK